MPCNDLVSQLSKNRQIVALLAILALSFIAAGLGSLASLNAGSFYSQLARPEWAPASNIFGPVWTVLYIMMSIAAWLVWRVGGYANARVALNLYLMQLFANALWTWLFFYWHSGALAFIDIMLLWGLIVATMGAFWRIRPLAGMLLIPYLLWVSFAAALNYSVWQHNPQLLG